MRWEVAMNKSIKPIEEVVTHGLFDPVLVNVDGKQLDLFHSILDAIPQYNAKGYQKSVCIAQKKGTHTFFAYFHDDCRDYCLTLESNWVGMRNRNY